MTAAARQPLCVHLWWDAHLAPPSPPSRQRRAVARAAVWRSALASFTFPLVFVQAPVLSHTGAWRLEIRAHVVFQNSQEVSCASFLQKKQKKCTFGHEVKLKFYVNSFSSVACFQTTSCLLVNQAFCCCFVVAAVVLTTIVLPQSSCFKSA